MMYTIKETIKTQEYNQIQIQKLVKTSSLEILSVSLEKNAIFNKHSSPTDVQIVVIEGDIVFHICGKQYNLTTQQNFCFPKDTEHWVSANENSKFLIIR